jgi:glycosyltransferase involved in cell wall biosynthesis
VTDSTRVSVLLCTHNGLAFIEEQLDSLVGQSGGVQADLHVSDDSSTDGTWEYLCRYADSGQLPLCTLRRGPGLGSAVNFLSLLADPAIEGDVFAFCDQDDIWAKDKLARAVEALFSGSGKEPILYCGRTRSVAGSRSRSDGLSPLFSRPPSFANALVQNIGGGNTMAMNRAARELFLEAGVVDVPAHDWWTYLLVSGAGGKVIYDPEPALSYRQHAGNQIGANTGLKRRLSRYLGAIDGRNRRWNDRNIAALVQNERLLTPENREILRIFRESRDLGPFQRQRGLRQAGLYAQTFSGNLGLFFASLLKKI